MATNDGNDYARDVKRKGLANAQQRMARQRQERNLMQGEHCKSTEMSSRRD